MSTTATNKKANGGMKTKDKRQKKKVARLITAFLLGAICGICGSAVAQTASSGSGGSTRCGGGPPDYCAPTDRVPRAMGAGRWQTNVDGSWTDSGPQIDLPFINEFGERVTRLTDGLSMPSEAGDCVTGPATWWANYISTYDPSLGGYYIFLPECEGKGDLLFELNATTMQAAQVCPSSWSGCHMPYASEWSYVTPGLMYYGSGTQIWEYCYDASCPSAKVPLESNPQELYDFSTCSGLTSYAGSGAGVWNVYADVTDTWFGVQFGHGAVAEWNASTGECYWNSAIYGLVGGSNYESGGNPAPIASSPFSVAPPPGQPSLSATSGSIAPGTYYVEETWNTDPNCPAEISMRCESTPSPYQTVTLTSTGGISVAVPTIPTSNYYFGSNGVSPTCNIYLGTTESNLTLQENTQSCTSAITISSYTTTGATPPTESAAGYLYHEQEYSLSGQWWLTIADWGQASFNPVWEVVNSGGAATNNVEMCTAYGCEGHISMGQQTFQFISDDSQQGSVPSHYTPATALYANANSSTWTNLLTEGPPFFGSSCGISDTHPSWNDSNPSDTDPVLISSFQDGGSNFSAVTPVCAWDFELIGVAADGSQNVYRFAHNWATGEINPLSAPDTSYNALSMPIMSRDGRLAIFATDWQFSLGPVTFNANNTSIGCNQTCAWRKDTSYTNEVTIIDSNGNVEESNGGTSGSTEPCVSGQTDCSTYWSTTAGGTTSDGSVTWTMIPGCTSGQEEAVPAGDSPVGKGQCRTDVFVVELH
jgi:hypothetical protein